MSNDSVTVTSRQGWFSRIKDAIVGVLFGFLFVLISLVALFWNEGRAVKTYKGLKEGSKAVVSVDAAKADPGNDGKLIHISGLLNSPETLSDSQFGLSENVLKMKRSVEMYQWKEDSDSKKKKKVGGAEETTTKYTYTKEWSPTLIASKNFQNPNGHMNPASFPYEAKDQAVTNASLGAFKLSEGLIFSLFEYENYSLVGKDSFPNAVGIRKIDDNTLYYGNGTPDAPEIGDTRISFSTIPHGDYSILAKQNGSGLTGYETSYGTNLEFCHKGLKTAAEMFEFQQSQNTIMTWVLRFVGWLFTVLGLSMIFKPLSVVADVVPFVGNLLEKGTGLFALILGSFLSLFVVAIAWIFYRPLFAILLIAIGAGLIFLFNRKGKGKETAEVV